MNRESKYVQAPPMLTIETCVCDSGIDSCVLVDDKRLEKGGSEKEKDMRSRKCVMKGMVENLRLTTEAE